MIELRGLKELQAKLEPSHYAGPFRSFWETVTNAGARAGASAAPKRSGHLAGSFSTEIDNSPLPGWGDVRNTAAYARPVQGGSRPHMPPVQALVGMAGSMDKAWAIARSIAKKGTKARPFIGQAFRATAASARQAVQTLANAIESRFG